MATYSPPNGFSTGSKTPVSVLQELLLRNNLVPQYELIHNGVGTHEPQFKYKLLAGTFVAIGNGKSKKEAKHDAARSILKKLHTNKALTASAQAVDTAEDIDVESPYSGAVKENLVGQLNNLCMVNNLPPPQYLVVYEEGPPHARVFTYSCETSTCVETASARTKKQAKHLVAQQMIKRLSDIFGDLMTQVSEKPPDSDNDEPEGTFSSLMLEGVRRNELNLGLPYLLYNVLPRTDDGKLIPILRNLIVRDMVWIHNHSAPHLFLKEILSELGVRYTFLPFDETPCTTPEQIERELANLSCLGGDENEEDENDRFDENNDNVEDAPDLLNDESGNETYGNEASGNDASGNEASGNVASGNDASGNVASGNEASGNEASGNEASGNEASGNEASGNEASGNDASGNEASGNVASGNDASGNDASGNEASGNVASGNDASGNEASGNEASGNDASGNNETENVENQEQFKNGIKLLSNGIAKMIKKRKQVITLTIHNSPPSVFFGRGSTFHEAIRSASTQALVFYYVQALSFKRN